MQTHKQKLLICFAAILTSCAPKTDPYGTEKSSAFIDGVKTYGLPIGGAAVGAALGGDSTQDKVVGAAIGGVAGGVASHFMNGNVQKEQGYKEGQGEGYTRGLSDAAKRHYWELQQNQAGGGSSAEGRTRLEEVAIPSTVTEDGRILMPRVVKMPITN